MSPLPANPPAGSFRCEPAHREESRLPPFGAGAVEARSERISRGARSYRAGPAKHDAERPPCSGAPSQGHERARSGGSGLVQQSPGMKAIEGGSPGRSAPAPLRSRSPGALDRARGPPSCFLPGGAASPPAELPPMRGGAKIAGRRRTSAHAGAPDPTRSEKIGGAAPPPAVLLSRGRRRVDVRGRGDVPGGAAMRPAAAAPIQPGVAAAVAAASSAPVLVRMPASRLVRRFSSTAAAEPALFQPPALLSGRRRFHPPSPRRLLPSRPAPGCSCPSRTRAAFLREERAHLRFRRHDRGGAQSARMRAPPQRAELAHAPGSWIRGARPRPARRRGARSRRPASSRRA
jgi:hypothetical protein